MRHRISQSVDYIGETLREDVPELSLLSFVPEPMNRGDSGQTFSGGHSCRVRTPTKRKVNDIDWIRGAETRTNCHGSSSTQEYYTVRLGNKREFVYWLWTLMSICARLVGKMRSLTAPADCGYACSFDGPV